MNPVIDVIVPCYGGAAETRRAIESVLSAKTQIAYELVIIDDASPEPELAAYVASLAGRAHVIRHERNQGFVASVNEGMRVHPGRDVVLLNSDTVVADGWLDRLAAHATQAADVASVTALTNHGSIASYPRLDGRNRLRLEETAAVAALAAEVNAGRAIEIPTAVGHCMWINRAAWNAIGEFDVAQFGTGYGEEVEWCLRAKTHGLRHLLAMDCYIYHQGEVSFGDGTARRQAAQRLIDEQYPHFGATVAEYLERDPGRPMRRALDLARLGSSTKPRVLMVTHNWGGGVARHVRDLIALCDRDVNVLQLKPADAGQVELAWVNDGEAYAAYFDPEREWDALVTHMRHLGISRIHYHHIHGLQQGVLDLPNALAVPFDVTLHDYFVLSPTYHLCDEQGRFREDWKSLEAPKPTRPTEARWPLTANEWRSVFATWLARAERVIAPSAALADLVGAEIPAARIVQWPHPETIAGLPPASDLKVLILGALSPGKGHSVVVTTAKTAKQRGDAVLFRVLGYLSEAAPLWPELPISVHGSYADDLELAHLIANERADVIWFPAQVPETFSYTLSVALASGLPIVASNIGALGERLATHSRARLLPPDAPPEAWLTALRAAAGRGDMVPAPQLLKVSNA